MGHPSRLRRSSPLAAALLLFVPGTALLHHRRCSPSASPPPSDLLSPLWLRLRHWRCIPPPPAERALVECDGESLDLSGDVGAVGRIVISNTAGGNHEMLLDLKGTIYQSTIVPSRTFCIVSFGQTEAKIEAIMNDFVQLKPHSNVFEAETMIEGTLDGFSFDIEDEGERIPKSFVSKGDQDDKSGDHADENSGKPAKSQGVKRKKATVAAKPPKKVARKAQVSRKSKMSKK